MHPPAGSKDYLALKTPALCRPTHTDSAIGRQDTPCLPAHMCAAQPQAHTYTNTLCLQPKCHTHCLTQTTCDRSHLAGVVDCTRAPAGCCRLVPRTLSNLRDGGAAPLTIKLPACRGQGAGVCGVWVGGCGGVGWGVGVGGRRGGGTIKQGDTATGGLGDAHQARPCQRSPTLSGDLPPQQECMSCSCPLTRPPTPHLLKETHLHLHTHAPTWVHPTTSTQPPNHPTTHTHTTLVCSSREPTQPLPPTHRGRSTSGVPCWARSAPHSVAPGGGGSGPQTQTTCVLVCW